MNANLFHLFLYHFFFFSSAYILFLRQSVLGSRMNYRREYSRGMRQMVCITLFVFSALVVGLLPEKNVTLEDLGNTGRGNFTFRGGSYQKEEPKPTEEVATPVEVEATAAPTPTDW